MVVSKVSLGCCCLSVLLVGLGQCVQPEVVLSQGILRGLTTTTLSGKVVSSFLGIPYAKPPTGKHRFKASVPAVPWTGIYNATTMPADCLQYDHTQMNTLFEIHGSEDCLYLNVFAPKRSNANPSVLYDVIMYIHGGAFQFHSSSSYTPEILLDRDLVLVTINYRLGPLGFLSTEDTVVPGNNGLKDQNLALKWVYNNILAFGGDPSKISIAGMSAGGSSVHYHILSPLSKGLFTHGISLSGTALCPWAQTENSKEKSVKLADYLGCPTIDSTMMVKCLRQRPAEKIVEATKIFMPFLYNPYTPFGPVVEPPSPTAFISKAPIDIILSKEANDVPYLVSFTSDEGLYPGGELISRPDYIERLETQWANLMPHVLDYNFTVTPASRKDDVAALVRKEYLGQKRISEDYGSFIKILSDRLFNTAIEQAAKLHASIYTSPVYMYKFSFAGEKSLADSLWGHNKIFKGTSHGDDLSYILKANYLLHDKNEKNLAMYKLLTGIWASFVKDAPMPNNWPPLKSSLPQITYLDINGPKLSEQQVVSATDGVSNSKFWESLDFQENVPSSSSVPNIRVEL